MANSTNTTVPNYHDFDRAAAVTYFIFFTLIVPLNALVIFVVTKKENRQSRLNFFILHLAIADLLIGLVNVLGDGIHSSMLGAYYGGDILCRIWRYTKIVLSIASNDLLIGLSIDRFLAVAFPMLAMKRGSQINRIFVIAAWLVGLVVPSFILPYSKGVNGEDGYCHITFGRENWWKIYVITIAMAMYILPTIIITLCYIGICVVVWKRWKQSKNLSEIHNMSADSSDQKYVETSAGMLSKARVKSLKMTLIICLAFFLCWTPYFVLTLLQVYNKGVGPALYTVLGALYCLNSLCNPLVFILFNKDKFSPLNMCKRPNHAEDPTTLVSYD